MSSLQSTAAVLHPVGREPSGRLVHVRDAQRGLASQVVCLTCGQPFVARQGEHNVWHFAHHVVGLTCGGGLMSDAHAYAQQILMDARQLTMPARYAQRALTWVADYSDPVMEARQPSGYVVDVLVQESGRRLGIEVRYRHAVDMAKRALIQTDGLAAIEIDISNTHPQTLYEPEAFRAYVLHGAARAWLHNDEALRVRLRHAEASRKWHLREPPYDDPTVPAPRLEPGAGEWTTLTVG